MKQKIKKYIKEIVVFIVILVIAMNIVSYYRSLNLNKQKLEIQNFTLIDGSSYEVKKDRPLLIYFWATWCPVCKFTSPNIQSLSKEYEVITLAVQSGTKEEILKYLDKHALNFNVVEDKEGLYASRFNISVFPTILFYDKNQNQKFSEVGYTSTWSLRLKMFFSK